jgi:GMP synthase-like glutamine amidotransferase
VCLTTLLAALRAASICVSVIGESLMFVAYCGEVRALLVGNSSDCDAGFSGERFRHHGYAFSECHREQPGQWPTLEGIDLVMLLGSDWSVYWPHIATEVAAERALIQSAHVQGIPVYGICYGAQMVASSLGGTVERARELELGWYDNIVSDIPEVIPSGPWLQWHADVVTVPPGAEELARSPLCSQAFRIGHTFVTQFHPEANESMLTRWANTPGANEDLAIVGLTPDLLREQTSRNVIESRPNAEHLVDWYLNRVAHG